MISMKKYLYESKNKLQINEIRQYILKHILVNIYWYSNLYSNTYTYLEINIPEG